MIGGFSAD